MGGSGGDCASSVFEAELPPALWKKIDRLPQSQELFRVADGINDQLNYGYAVRPLELSHLSENDYQFFKKDRGFYFQYIGHSGGRASSAAGRSYRVYGQRIMVHWEIRDLSQRGRRYVCFERRGGDLFLWISPSGRGKNGHLAKLCRWIHKDTAQQVAWTVKVRNLKWAATQLRLGRTLPNPSV